MSSEDPAPGQPEGTASPGVGGEHPVDETVVEEQPVDETVAEEPVEEEHPQIEEERNPQPEHGAVDDDGIDEDIGEEPGPEQEQDEGAGTTEEEEAVAEAKTCVGTLAIALAFSTSKTDAAVGCRPAANPHPRSKNATFAFECRPTYGCPDERLPP